MHAVVLAPTNFSACKFFVSSSFMIMLLMMKLKREKSIQFANGLEINQLDFQFIHFHTQEKNSENNFIGNNWNGHFY